MFKNHALIFYYHKINSYSFNALAGAIDADTDLADIPIGIAFTADELREQISEALENHSRAAAAFSIMTCQFEEAARLIRRLRGEYGGRLIILAGGPHVTARPQEVLRAGADIVFRGEAENSFPRVLKAIFQRTDCAAVQSADAPADLDRTFSFSPERGMFGPIEITRGCAFACRFCQTSQIFGVRLRHRSVEKIVRQAESLRSINRKVVRLLSPNAFSYGSPDGRKLNLDAIRGLLAALRESLSTDGRIIFAHFPSEARPEHITHDTLSLLDEFADNDEIVIGAQSGSQRMLDACGRAHTAQDVISAVARARKHGYKIIVDFMFGLPGENDADRRESLSVMKEIVDMGARIHPHIFAPLPQTAFANEPSGRILPFFLNAMDQFRERGAIYGSADGFAIIS
ncbi:MAG: TIGR04013 family B12-binding domain/radical SAM domain-containing protein [Acidobacteriota bacterium]|jgi:B12-binding domain/radical SAM domain protein|nr:TIGR04013 family B12-binding domain/radical SAM domain-containing protein [Acidobacteriota bacterium]